MNRRLSIQAPAFGLAAMITLSLLAAMNQFATQPHEQAQIEMAEKAATVPVVVIEAKRTTRS